MIRLTTLATGLASGLLLAACGPLVQIGGNAKAPATLLTLRATAAAPAPDRVADMKRTLNVIAPQLAGPLQTLRLPVITSDTELSYLTGAVWAEQPSKPFARVLADTISARGIPVLGPRSAGAGATRALGGTLVDFSLDVRNPAQPRVLLRYNAVLTGDGGKTLAIKRFDQSVPVSSQSPVAVGAALNTAANALAAEVADWVER